MNETQGKAPLAATHVNVSGMHCINCAVLIERRLAALPQVRRVTVAYPGGYALITYSGELGLPAIQNALGDDGYTVSARDPAQPIIISQGNTGRDYLEIAAAFLVLAGIAALLHQFNLLPRWTQRLRQHELWAGVRHRPRGLRLQLSCGNRRPARGRRRQIQRSQPAAQ